MEFALLFNAYNGCELGNLIVYKSSAGSGKTYTLVRSYLKLVLTHPSPTYFKQILAITFTNKAAQELKERVIESLKKLSCSTDDPLYDAAYLEDIVAYCESSPALIQKRAETVLRHMLHNYADLSISTIDKFTHKIIRTFARDLNLSSDFEIDTDEKGIRTRAIDELLAQVGTSDKLTAILLAFIQFKTGEDQSWDIENDILKFSTALNDEEAVHFVKQLKKTDETAYLQLKDGLSSLIARFENYLSGLATEALTLMDSNGLSVDAFFQKKNGIPGYFTKIANHDYSKIGNHRYAEAFISDEKKRYSAAASPHEKSTVDAIHQQLSAQYENIESHYEKHASDYHLAKMRYKNLFSFALISELQQEIENVKDQENIVSISDFNRHIHEIILNQPVPFVYERLGERYNHFLIDEFQDTSTLQWQNLLPLVENALSKNYQNLLVGDGKQAIYRWRGGEVEQFAQLPEIYNHRNAPQLLDKQPILRREYEELVLEHNYRSQQNIVEFNNRLFDELQTVLPEHLQSIYHKSAQHVISGKTSGHVHVRVLPEAEDWYEAHAQAVLNQIQDLVERGYPYQDVALITRNNKHANYLAEYLLRAEIPVVSSESLLLSKAPKIEALLAAMRLICESDHTVSAVKLLRYLIVDDQQYTDLILQHSKSFKEKGQYVKTIDVRTILKKIGIDFQPQFWVTMPLFQLVEKLIHQFGLHEQPDAYVQFFLDTVQRYSTSKGESLPGFLDWWEESGTSRSIVIPEEIDAVRILTIHKSKGLQFPVVILPFCNWIFRNTKDLFWTTLPGKDEISILPLSKELEKTELSSKLTSEKGASLLDQINLLYVALTRPEEELYVFTDLSHRQENMGKLLLKQLSTFPQWNEDEQSLSIGVPQLRTAQNETKQEHFLLEKVISSNWRKQLFMSSEAEKSWGNEEQYEANLFGQLVHKLLSEIQDLNDWESLLNRFVTKGLLTSEQAATLKGQLGQLFAQPQMQRWFAPDVKSLNESEIMGADGEFYRPDKIIVTGSNTCDLVDFKTGAHREKYVAQLAQYELLLQDLGFEQVSKYLVYLSPVEIMPVN